MHEVPESPAPAAPSVVTVGVFDGVHMGHAAIIRECARIGGLRGALVAAMPFRVHPAAVLRPESTPAPLCDWDTRRRLLTVAGANVIDPLDPTPEILAMSPEEFVLFVKRRRSPVAWVEGPDFRFGKGRTGDVEMLERLGRAHGFSVHTVPPFEVVLGDHSIVEARSSLARWLLGHGRVRDAATMLGRPHALCGEVVKGDQRGRTIGFPTANVAVRGGVVSPGDGVYAARARIRRGEVHAAAVNIGERPTFNGFERRIEAHLIGTDLGGSLEYGWEIEIEFLSRVRDQVRFASVEDLKEQLARDCARVREIVSRENTGKEAA